MMNDQKCIVWIASYPKSGNTWLRFLVCNLVFGPVESAAMLNEMAPDLHELPKLPELTGQLQLMKTHYGYSRALPLAARTAAAVYVTRDPADVMISNFHYSQRRGASTGDSGSFDRYVSAFIEARGDPRWVKLNMGSWEQNVRSWLGAKHEFPVLWLRYEDMLKDALAAAGRLRRFLGLDRTELQLSTAVAEASFERMRQIEQSDIRDRRVGIFYKPYLQESIAAGLRFMRSGQPGEAQGLLSDEQRRRFHAAFGTLRAALGYQ